MNAHIAILVQALLVSHWVCADDARTNNARTNAVSLNEEQAWVASTIEDLRSAGVLQDMRKHGLLTNSVSEITAGELIPAMWKFKGLDFPLVSEPAAWDNIPPPDLRGTNDPGGVQLFIRTNCWNMGEGIVGATYGRIETRPIRDLPWGEIRHREFEATTGNGVLYVILGAFSHNMYGIAYNPQTNRFDPHLDGFSPVGDHWYAWRQHEDPVELPQRYEGETKATGQPDVPANRSEPIGSKTNPTSSAVDSRR